MLSSYVYLKQLGPAPAYSRHMQQPTIYLSRAFVEFGPMTEEEVVAFYQRGILHISDHVRTLDQPDWMPVTEWAVAKGCTPRAALPLKNGAVVKGQGKAA